MPFTNVWTNTNPLGSVSAASIDDEIRKHRLDIFERMNAAVVNDWTADPLVLKPAVSGLKTGKQLVISGHAFTNYSAMVTDGAQFGPSGAVHASISLPPGTTIKLLEVLVNSSLNATITTEFYSRTFVSPPAADVLVTPNVVSTANGNRQMTSAAINYLVLGSQRLHLKVGVGPTALVLCTVYGIRITYDAPDHLSTI